MPSVKFDEKTFPPLAIRAQLRWHVVGPIVKGLAPHDTIEVGVGAGAMGARIAALSSGSYTAWETDEVAYAQAAERITPHGGVVHNVMLGEAPPAPADLLCAFEVLEHIEDDVAALTEWATYVKPGGHFVGSVPADPTRFGPMDEHAGHFRRYTAEQFTRLAESAGFGNVRITHYGLPLGYALEGVRNQVDKRKLANRGDKSIEELTAASGRTFQFDQRNWKTAVIGVATAPFAAIQKYWPKGVGLVIEADKL